MSFFDDAISSIGRGLAQTAVKAASDATGYDVGGTINALFGNGQTQGGQDLAQTSIDLGSSDLSQGDIAQLQNGITQQQAQVAELGGKVDAIAAEVGELRDEIKDMEALLTQIHQDALYTKWSIVNTPIRDHVSAIQTSYAEYGQYMVNATTTRTELVASYINTVLDPNQGPMYALNALKNDIVDDGQSEGVLQLWSGMVSDLVAAGLVDYRDAVAQYQDYYSKLAYAQLQAVNLVMEAYNFSDAAPEAVNAWATYRSNLIEQEQAFIRWLTPLVAAGIKGGSKNGWTYGAAHAAMQMNPCLQQLPSSPNTKPTSYYEPSSIYEEAERLLATLSVTDEGQRRIVVHMMYDGSNAIVSAVKGVIHSLHQVTAIHHGRHHHGHHGHDGSHLLKDTVIQTFGPYPLMEGKMADVTIDMTFYSNNVWLNRYVFEWNGGELADGQYRLTNQNGNGGLVPIETYPGSYFSYVAPFTDDGPLGYVMPISQTTPYAFMNYVAYNVPELYVGSSAS